MVGDFSAFLGRVPISRLGEHRDLVLLRERGDPAPSPRLLHVPELRAHQLGLPLVLNDQPRRQPDRDAGAEARKARPSCD